MRYGIFSDTHGNLSALRRVLDTLEKQGVDKLVCLGDSVGYGPQPNECCDIIRDVADITIMGNHDAAVAGQMDYSYYYDAARNALDHHATVLTPDNLAWLRALPYISRQGETHFCHGSPVDLREFEYIFSTEQAATCLPMWDELGRATFIGHSHLCKSFAISRDRVYEVVTKTFELREGFKYIISVGSVGQPRDHDPRACGTVYDTDAQTFEFVRVDYDVEATAKAIFDNSELSDAFATRLFAGV